ncbi:cell division inhibitor MinD [Haladaptatus sp. W1]|uniref:nucleotide-binding protein n=1 Tax=Haladaptatus sp. W1 TaxID=1897478 RepID=UPI000849AF9C|nr:P-loop NTPase [Haladaptatus sp. W1]ODR81326.1 cell division inhibitor MinD [Haladaptatus sp. W1]
MLAIAGGKGGCGKTTTTLGLAGALGRMRRSVLAADADVDMPDLHHLANVDGTPNLTAVENGEAVEIATHPPPTLSGVEVVPAPQSMGDSVHLPSALSRLADAADHVLVDCPAGAGPDAATPLRLADHVLLVTTTDPACLRDTAKTAAMARALGTTIVGVALTRTEHPPTGIERLLDGPVLASIPNGGVAVLSDESVRRAYDRLASALLTKHL